MGVNEHFEPIFNAVMRQLKGFKIASQRGSIAIGLRSILVLSVVFLAYTANAQLSQRHPHNGLLRPYHAAPPDVALSSDERQQLKMGEPVYTRVDAAGDMRPAVVFRVAAPPAVIWSVINDFAAYPKWIEGLADAEVYRSDGADVFVRFQIRRWFIGSITYYAHHTYPFPDVDWGTWKLDYSRNSDFDDTVGFWRVLPVAGQLQSSDVTYSAQVQLKGWFAGLLNRMLVKDTLRQISTWIKTQSELRAMKVSEKKYTVQHSSREQR